jgi:pyoverdine/dityrosine biosynthesis protein Dit1
LIVGVDDEAVGNYDQALASGYRRMYTSPEDHEAIRFRGLTDIFFSNPDSLDNFNHKWADSFHVDHPIHSRRLPEAELARQIMMTGFQSSRDHFRKLIAEQHPPTLSLYRGQARFMQDDLTDPTFLAMSGKQRKKLSFTVAAEMIARNQAYSNLLELLLPNYVRLSIHAHSNRGPKFGICLFPRNQVHAIEAVMNRHALCPSYEFQVPTPWHNSIIKVDGDSVLYLGKAEIVQKAIEQGDFEGGWVQDVVQGGYFVLRSTSTVCEAPSAATDLSSASTIYTNFEKEKFSRAEHETVEMVVTRPSHDELGIRFAVRLRAKVCRALKLSRRFIDRLTKDTIRLRSSKREVAANPC